MDVAPVQPRRGRLLVCVCGALAATIGFGVWFSVAAPRAQDQNARVFKIRAVGGEVYYDYEYGPPQWSPGANGFMCLTGIGEETSPWPEWLIADGRLDYFHRANDVRLRSPSVDADVHLALGLRGLTQLSIGQYPHDDAFLWEDDVPRRPARSTSLTANAFAPLVGASNLNSLTITLHTVGEAGFAHIARAPALERLTLTDVDLNDAGLKHLQNSPSLKHLVLADVDVTDAGLAAFRAARPDCEVKVSIYRADASPVGAPELEDEMFE